jgi:trans-aconitate 2-methyltransferase
MSWDPAQYLKYAGERLRPALDLLARVPLDAPATIADLGCGAGNVTRLLAERWPEAAISGVDNSAAMLEQARLSLRGRPRVAWVEAELGAWTASAIPESFSLLYSNAALHWLDDHDALFPRLLASVASGGALAVQMPSNFAAPSHTALQELVASAPWRERLAPLLRPTPVAPLARYFECLAPHARTIDAWTTEYLHVLAPNGEGEHPVVAWTKGTALTPFLAVLDAQAQSAFLAAYRARIERAYPVRGDGRVLYPFQRLFVVARR